MPHFWQKFSLHMMGRRGAILDTPPATDEPTNDAISANVIYPKSRAQNAFEQLVEENELNGLDTKLDDYV